MMIYLTEIELAPGGSSTVHIYTQTVHRTTQQYSTHLHTKQYTEQHSSTVYIYTQTVHRTTQQ
jgi:hypothetical protein